MVDYTKLLEKIVPKVDGESTLRLRTGTVTTVNADGTLDITMSDGVLAPNVNKLVGAYAPVGAVVKMITFLGAMLVIGAVSTQADTPLYSTTYSGTTDGSGHLTVTHGCPYTPTGGWAITTNPGSSFAGVWGIDTIGATTCRLRFQNIAATGSLNSTAVSGRLWLTAI
jgi:hypothetical protein